jgi:hypothetical protein
MADARHGASSQPREDAIAKSNDALLDDYFTDDYKLMIARRSARHARRVFA